MRAGHAKPFANSVSLTELALSLAPAAFALDPAEAFGQAVAVDHQVVVGEGRCLQQIGAPHGKGIQSELGRHLVEQALKSEADVDGAVAAEGAAGRRIGEHAPTDILDV